MLPENVEGGNADDNSFWRFCKCQHYFTCFHIRQQQIAAHYREITRHGSGGSPRAVVLPEPPVAKRWLFTLPVIVCRPATPQTAAPIAMAYPDAAAGMPASQ